MTNTFFRTILLFSVLIGIGYSQFKTPVTISTEVENSSRPGEVAHVLIKASMDDEWHIYALENAGEGPVASRIKISGDILDEQGLIEHREPIEKFDEGFGVKTRFFKGTTEGGDGVVPGTGVELMPFRVPLIGGGGGHYEKACIITKFKIRFLVLCIVINLYGVFSVTYSLCIPNDTNYGFFLYPSR